jgi:lysophospholipase L1-like esterase
LRLISPARLPLIWMLLAGCAAAQTAPVPAGAGGAMLGQKETEQLATRMLQLMESTAVAVPGLIRASEPVKQNAEMTFTAMQRTPQSPALTYQFMNQVKAYLALSDSIPRPYPFPATADQQYSELREDLQRMQQHFEAILRIESVAGPLPGPVVQSETTSALKGEIDPNDLKRYGDADTKLLPPTKLARVVFLGDSITDAWRLNEYFTGRDFINRGIAGQTTTQMLGRFRQDVVAVNPKAVVILAGTNDIAAGISLKQMEDNLAMMADMAKARGIKTIFASVLPVSDYHKDVDRRYEMTKAHPPATILLLNHWIQSHCQSEGLVYIDYYSSMIDSSGHMQTDLSDDGLHPNAKGYRVMSGLALNAISRALPGQNADPQDAQEDRRFRIQSK